MASASRGSTPRTSTSSGPRAPRSSSATRPTTASSWRNASASDALSGGPELTVAAFNAHWGVGRFGAQRGRRFDVVAAIRAFDADVVVVPEAFRDLDGSAVLEPLTADGYRISSSLFRRLEPHDGLDDLRPAGEWELSVCSRLPVVEVRHIPLRRVFRDHADARTAIACTVDVAGTEVDVIGVHVSSKLWYAGPAVHLRALRPHLPPPGRPAVVAGDCNLWGPGVVALLPGWRRAVVGRTYPANRPHSQIDHILVNRRFDVLDGRVLHDVGSDHRPVVARLRIR